MANLLTGLGIDEVLVRTESTGALTFLTDILGSTIALADSTGTIQTQYSYEPFGRTLRTGASSSNGFKFTGREDDATKMYYFRARYYHPELQRFISKDPIGFRGGQANLYAYVFNSPVNFTDPTGEFIPAVVIVAGGVIGAGVNVGMAAAANGGNLTASQAASAAVSGFVSGMVGAVAGPAGGSIAGALGGATNGIGAAVAAGAISALGGAAGQALANPIDPCSATNPLNAGLWAGIGGGLAKGLFPTKNLNSLAQASYFAPSTIGGLFGSRNAGFNAGSFGASAGVDGASNWPQLSPF